jgi:CheY-like chemotaxis protein
MRARFGPRVDRLVDYREYPILFVDDEPENLRIFELTFRSEFQIRTVSGGQEALQSLHDHPAALVVADHRMAGMSGVELLARVREIDARTPRILVTAYADEATLKDAINEGGIYRYLAKPWRPDEMRLALRDGIEVHALLREREELLREMEALNRISRLLNRELELIPLLDLVLGIVTEEFSFGGATVFLFDADEARLKAVRSAPREEAGGTARLADLDIPGTTGRIFLDRLREGRTQMLRIADSSRLETPVRRFVAEVAADEMLALPLAGRAGVIGALMVDNRHGGENFDAADYTLLEGLTHHAGIAVENARLVSDLTRSQEQSGLPDRLGTWRTLAADLAHEIDDPLVAIRRFLSLAPAKRRDEDHEFWVSDHDVAMREIDRIRELLRMMEACDRDAGDVARRRRYGLPRNRR